MQERYALPDIHWINVFQNHICSAKVYLPSLDLLVTYVLSQLQMLCWLASMTGRQKVLFIMALFGLLSLGRIFLQRAPRNSLTYAQGPIWQEHLSREGVLFEQMEQARALAVQSSGLYHPLLV